jgi:acyl transferase domain-containing protein
MAEEELKALDPQQRLLLETSFEAIESGMIQESLAF